MTIEAAQREMRGAYWSGALGMFASATAWLVAGVFALSVDPGRSVWALFVGGALIHPVAQLLLRAFGRPARHSPENPLGRLAFEGTVWMILCLPLAYVVSRHDLAWFFPAMLLVIGGRYLTFATLFGLRAYWMCGALLAAAAYVLVRASAAPSTGAFVGASIEALFALYLLLQGRGVMAA